MNIALREAQKSSAQQEVPIGAVITINKRIIARAHNQVEQLRDPTAHAEILAIGAACLSMRAKYLPQARLYVTVEPCLMCYGAIVHAHIREVIFGCPERKYGFSHFVCPPPYIHIRGGLEEERCRLVLQNFFIPKR